MGPAGPGGPSDPIDRNKLFNGKELVTSAKSAYELSWPILVWGMLVLLLYGISYNNLSSEQDTMVYIKMTQKSRVAASRVTYYTMGAALNQVSMPRYGPEALCTAHVSGTCLCQGLHACVAHEKGNHCHSTVPCPLNTLCVVAAALQDVSERQRLQALLGDEASHLAWVYTSALYGTISLHGDDTAAQGDFDENTGCLFAGSK